jgi:excisionase family DNA binding protein
MTEDAIYLRAGEIAQLLGMSERTIRRWIADEIIPSTREPQHRLHCARRPLDGRLHGL